MIKFKRLEPLLAPVNEKSDNITVPVLSKKSSRIWGADEEYNYDRASKDIGYVVGLPQPV